MTVEIKRVEGKNRNVIIRGCVLTVPGSPYSFVPNFCSWAAIKSFFMLFKEIIRWTPWISQVQRMLGSLQFFLEHDLVCL